MAQKFRDKPRREPTPRALLLFLLPAPLLAIALGSLFDGNWLRTLLSGGLLAALWLGAFSVRQGLVAEANFRKLKHATRAPAPLKTLGAVITGVATAMTGWWLSGKPLIEASLFGFGAFVGTWMFYGLDPRRRRLDRVLPDDVDVKLIETTLSEAEAKILAIEQANSGITCPELTHRLERIADQSRNILDVLVDNPKVIRRARKFLNTYLEGARRVAEGYARTHSKANSQELDANFRNVLVTIEDVFQEQHQKLLENDVLDLDVEIEVLKTQLEREGVS